MTHLLTQLPRIALPPIRGVLAALLLTACSGSDRLDIGDNVQQTELSLSNYVANWEGYAEATTFRDLSGPTDSDRVVLLLNNDGSGSIRVGNAEPIPVADPSGEPPLGGQLLHPELISGFEYPVSNPRVEQRRLRVSFDPRQPLTGWCTAQTPQATGDPMLPYNCTPYSPDQFGTLYGDTCAFVSPDNSVVEIPCGRFNQCSGMGECHCDEDSCESWYHVPGTLDAALSQDGQELEGTLVVNETRIIVRMTKQ